MSANHPTGPTIFDKILDGSIPAQFIHQDDKCVAFKDVAPQAPVHFLVIPRKRITMIEEAEDRDRLWISITGGSSINYFQ